MDKTYTIGEVCSQFGLKEQSLRYLEKNMDGIIEIQRDTFNNRIYKEKDMKLLETILSLKEQGLNYTKIKEILSKNEILMDKASDPEHTTDETAMVLTTEKFNSLITTLQTNITESVTNAVSKQVDDLKEDFNKQVQELKKQNEMLQKQLEGHYKDTDEKLVTIREQLQEKKKTSWVKKFFGVDS